MARIVGDVEVLGVGVREFTIETWDTLLFSLSFFVAMLMIDARLTVLSLIPVPLAMLLAHATGRWVASRTTRAREASADLTSTLQEHLAGTRVLRLFGRASASVERVAGLSRRFAQRNLELVRLKAGLQPVYATIMTSGVVLIVWQGSERVIAGAMTVGAFVAYLELFLRFVNRGHRIPQLVNSLQSGAAAYARLRPLLAPALPVAGEPRFASFRAGHVAGITRRTAPTGRPQVRTASLSLRDVTFQYPGAEAPVLRGLNLDIPAGALVAVTGPVGSGKSALARAILGIHPVTSGSVLLDGKPLGELPAGERRGLVGYLPQDTLVVLGLAAAEHRVRPRRPGGDDGVPGGRSGWPPSRTMSPDSRRASTPRSERRASGSPAASGSASGWRAPWRPRRPVLPLCSSSTIRSRPSTSRPRRPSSPRSGRRSGPRRLRRSGSPSSCARTAWRASRTPTSCSCSSGEWWWKREPMRSCSRPTASTRASSGRSAPPSRRRWSRRDDDRPHGCPSERQRCPRAGGPASGGLLAQRRGSVVRGRAPGARGRRVRAGPAARRSRHRRSPSDRWSCRGSCGARAPLPAGGRGDAGADLSVRLPRRGGGASACSATCGSGCSRICSGCRRATSIACRSAT